MVLTTYMRSLLYATQFGKPTKLSHLVFQEILILNIQATVVPLCWIAVMPNILYNWNSVLASIL